MRRKPSSGWWWEEWNFEVDAAGAFEVNFDEVGAAGGENPDDAAAVFLVAHFLGEHGVDAAGDGGFAAAGIAAAEGLVGFVDEDVAFADAFDGAENPFEVALGAAIPFVAESFSGRRRGRSLHRRGNGRERFCRCRRGRR
jgi:hypothetical protein